MMEETVGQVSSRYPFFVLRAGEVLFDFHFMQASEWRMLAALGASKMHRASIGFGEVIPIQSRARVFAMHVEEHAVCQCGEPYAGHNLHNPHNPVPYGPPLYVDTVLDAASVDVMRARLADEPEACGLVVVDHRRVIEPVDRLVALLTRHLR